MLIEGLMTAKKGRVIEGLMTAKKGRLIEGLMTAKKLSFDDHCDIIIVLPCNETLTCSAILTLVRRGNRTHITNLGIFSTICLIW